MVRVGVRDAQLPVQPRRGAWLGFGVGLGVRVGVRAEVRVGV